MNAKERIKTFAKSKKMTNQQLESQAGLSNGYIANMRNSVGKKGLELISKTFPELNIGWLLTGEGEMLRGENIQQIADRHSIIGHGNTTINVSLPPQGYQKIIKSDGSETIVEVASSGHDVSPHDFAAEKVALLKEIGDLKNKIISLQDRLLENK